EGPLRAASILWVAGLTLTSCVPIPEVVVLNNTGAMLEVHRTQLRENGRSVDKVDSLAPGALRKFRVAYPAWNVSLVAATCRYDYAIPSLKWPYRRNGYPETLWMQVD